MNLDLGRKGLALKTNHRVPSFMRRESAMLKFQIFRDAVGEFRWRLKAANGEVIATSSEGYASKTDCKHGIDLIQKGATEAKVEDES